LHVVSNTHWDREWRHPFQHMRMDLVEMMDRLLEICEREKDFKHYHLDSQTILLEDYIEIRPEKRALLEKHIKSGKILVGPWYTLPDFFIVSAEAIVRNLLMGHKVAKQFGQVMKVGYTPCSYGQVSQMAQIYHGFEVDSIIFYRGIDAHGLKSSEYRLEAADGTQILGIKLPVKFTRFNFRFNVFSETMYTGDNAYDGKILFHNITPGSEHSSFKLMHKNQPHTYHPDKVIEGFKYAKSWVNKMATTKHLLLMDGFDASYPHPNTGYIIRDANETWPQDQVVHSSFPAFIQAVRECVDWEKLPVVKGEQRHPAVDTNGTSIMQGVLVSQAAFKRLNHDAQILAEKIVEPLAVFAWMAGAEYPRTFIDLVWKFILSNHGHDTVCGPSVDQIYKDATYRLEQACLIADGISDRSEFSVLESVTERDFSQNYQVITVFNTLQQERTEVVEAFLDISQSSGSRFFRIENFQGKSIPYEILDYQKVYGVDEDGDAAYSAIFVHRYKISFMADSVPSFGFKCFKVVTADKAEPISESLVATAAHSMENEFLKVTINSDGSLNILNKTTGRLYTRQNTFEDGGDAGTPWYYIRPENDRTCQTQDIVADKIDLVENTTLAATCRITQTLSVPVSLTVNKKRRRKKERTIEIVSDVRLTLNSKWVSIHTEVDTSAEDHRLRVAFPTQLKVEKSWSESQFDAVARPVDFAVDSSKWIDKELGIQPQQNWVDLFDGKEGLAILNKGLRDYEISQDDDRSIAITLLHGVRYPRIAGGANPWADDPYILSSQSKGKFEYDYAIYPHSGNWQKTKLYFASREFNVPLRLIQITTGINVHEPEMSFFRVHPETLILSALKIAEKQDTVILRVFNPISEPIAGRIECMRQIANAWQVNLEENRLAELVILDKTWIEIKINAKKIVTIELELK